jgi:hypothetical protein
MRILHLALAISLLHLAAPARAGGPFCTEADRRAVEAAQHRWGAKKGKAVIPELLRSLCAKNLCLHLSAAEALAEQGLPAAMPLIDQLKGPPCSSLHNPEDPDAAGVLARLLCKRDAGGAGWERIDRLLLGAVDGRDERLAQGAMSTLGQLAFAVDAPTFAGAGRCGEAPRRVTAEPRCAPESRRLVASSVQPLLRVLTASPPATIERQRRALRALGNLGPRAAPAAATIARLLESDSLVREALEALRLIGPDAAPAVDALRGLLRRRKTVLAREVALALAAIGPRARAAKAELIALGPSLTAQLGDLQNGWSARSSLQELVSALAILDGDLAAGEQALLLQLLRDDRVGIELRHCGARVLKQKGSLGAGERRLAELLERKVNLLRNRRPDLRQLLPPPQQLAFERLQREVAVCRQEAGLSPIDAATLDGTRSLAFRANQEMAGCLADRICGPDANAYRRVIDACCARAYGKAPPAMCRAR